MIIEQHYDDEVLIDLLDEGEGDAHVPACDTCSGTLESYRDLSAALHDDSVWDERELPEAPSPQTTNFLRVFAERSRAEDIAAGPIVAKLIADPSAIDPHPEWRTAGVVRGLLKHVDSINFSDPGAAVLFARLAVQIAESLEPSIASMRLTASAWHELGYALFSKDQFSESLGAYETAESLFEATGVSEFDIANVGLHRAQLYSDFERIDEALAIVQNVRRVFERYGARKREAVADATEATLLMKARRYAQALQVHQRIAAEPAVDDTARAFAHHNAAVCLGELGRFNDARRAFVRAISEFERLRLVSMRTRSRWAFGKILLAEESYEQAFATFSVARAEFEELGLHHEVALIAVDTAETLFGMGRTSEIAAHCQSAMDYFAKAGLAYTQGALTALAFLKEAAESRMLTKSKVGQIRGFFELLPKQPHLLFAFPL